MNFSTMPITVATKFPAEALKFLLLLLYLLLLQNLVNPTTYKFKQTGVSTLFKTQLKPDFVFENELIHSESN